MGMISMPQMIGSANAQSERGSERACPVPGSTLEKGECTAPPIRTVTCIPSTVGGRPAQPISDTACRASGTTSQITGGVCGAIEGGVRSVTGGPSPVATCTFPATVTITCPGGITPTDGKCITKPGQGNDPT
jgi:hypothetical protein